MSEGRISDNHFVAALGVLEEIVDSLFLHEPARKIEVCLAVLDAELSMLVLAVKLEVTIKSIQHLFEDIWNRLLLKNPTLRSTGEQPNFGDHFRVITGELFVSITLGKTGTDAVDVPPVGRSAFPRSGDAERYVVPHELAKIDRR